MPNEHCTTNLLSNYRCSDCGSVFIGNNITSEELAEAYSTLDSAGYYADIETENRQKMANAIKHLEDLISKTNSLIDVGTGNGLFVKLLKESGFENVSAHEIEGSDLSGIRLIAENLFQDHDYHTIPDNSFDAVTLLDVVEHVPAPEFLIKTCARILRDNGLIYFHTPVVTHTDRLMHGLQRVRGLRKAGLIWQRGRTSIFHLQNYTRKALTDLLARCGFGNIEIDVRNELSWPLRKYVEVSSRKAGIASDSCIVGRSDRLSVSEHKPVKCE